VPSVHANASALDSRADYRLLGSDSHEREVAIPSKWALGESRATRRKPRLSVQNGTRNEKRLSENNPDRSTTDNG